MKPALNINIKQRIAWSFSLLVILFAINGIITVVVLNNNNKQSSRIATTADPSIESLHELRKVIRESMLVTTNWVFAPVTDENKLSVHEVQDSAYPAIRARLNRLSANWSIAPMKDSLHQIFRAFDSLINGELSIMTVLSTPEDYTDVVKKTRAEKILKTIVVPVAQRLSLEVTNIMSQEKEYKRQAEAKLEKAFDSLQKMIILFAVCTVCLGIFFAIYMGRKIIQPIQKIHTIIHDLGKGTIRKMNIHANGDEVGRMIVSVNSLAEKLESATTFAHETGLRNFDMPFTPLSEQDTLGIALLAMRQNLKAGETNLEIKNRELERKNKELEEFAFVASHDLQEPLRTTSSYVGLLQQQYKGRLDEKADKYLSYISQASDRMEVLITDLLEYSRIGDKKELTRVNCDEILTEVLADLQVAIKETAAEITAGNLPVICGHRTEIKQLFQNLVFNSIKFRQTDVPPRITIAAWENKDSWQFAFSDNGIGIAKEHFDRIFIIFQRLHTRNKYQGSGIGLSHCKKIVELHKGKIWLESEPGQGTTFYFTIPQKLS